MNDKSPAVRKLLKSLTNKIWSMPWSLEDIITTTTSTTTSGTSTSGTTATTTATHATPTSTATTSHNNPSDINNHNNNPTEDRSMNNNHNNNNNMMMMMDDTNGDKLQIYDMESFEAVYMLTGQNIGNALWYAGVYEYIFDNLLNNLFNIYALRILLYKV